NALTLGGGGGCGAGTGGGSASATPGTPTMADAPKTPVRTLLSTAIAYVSQKRPAVFLPECVAAIGASDQYWPGPRPHLSSSLRIRSSIGGCVENNLPMRSPLRNGFAIIRWA